jgi:hypothetical protein
MVFHILEKYIVAKGCKFSFMRSSLLEPVNDNNKSIKFLYLSACQQQVALTGEH